MRTLSSHLLLILGLLVFAGCATTSLPPALAPVSPAASPPAVVEFPPASITGSEQTSTMLDNFTVFITAVDGVSVAAGRQGWNTPITLKAGPHRLTLGFNRGVFAAQAEVELTAVSAATYQIRFASDAQLFGQNSYCEFWIVDTATGQPVSPRVRSGLTRTESAK